jgi:hypothetical protein
MKTIALLLCVFQCSCLMGGELDRVIYFMQLQIEEAREAMQEDDVLPWEYNYWYGRYTAFEETLDFIQGPMD